MACGILVPRPGIKLASPAVEVWRFNHWTAREVPPIFYFTSENTFVQVVPRQHGQTVTFMRAGTLAAYLYCSSVSSPGPGPCRLSQYCWRNERMRNWMSELENQCHWGFRFVGPISPETVPPTYVNRMNPGDCTCSINVCWMMDGCLS